MVPQDRSQALQRTLAAQGAMKPQAKSGGEKTGNNQNSGRLPPTSLRG
jgi:hypothetical protein